MADTLGPSSYATNPVSGGSQAQGTVSPNTPKVAIEGNVGARLTSEASGGEFAKQAAYDNEEIDGLVKIAGDVYKPQLLQQQKTLFMKGFTDSLQGQTLQQIKDSQPWYTKIFGDNNVVAGARSYTAAKNVNDFTSTVIQQMPNLKQLAPNDFSSFLNTQMQKSMTGDPDADNAIQQQVMSTLPSLMSIHTKENFQWNQQQAKTSQFNYMKSQVDNFSGLVNSGKLSPTEVQSLGNSLVVSMAPVDGQYDASHQDNLLQLGNYLAASGNTKVMNTVFNNDLVAHLDPDKQVAIQSSIDKAQTVSKNNYKAQFPDRYGALQAIINNPNATPEETIKATNDYNTAYQAYSLSDSNQRIVDPAASAEKGYIVQQKQQQDIKVNNADSAMAPLKAQLEDTISRVGTSSPEAIASLNALMDTGDAQYRLLTGNPSAKYFDHAGTLTKGLSVTFDQEKELAKLTQEDQTKVNAINVKLGEDKENDALIQHAIITGNVASAFQEIDQNKGTGKYGSEDAKQNAIFQGIQSLIDTSDPKNPKYNNFFQKLSDMYTSGDGGVIIKPAQNLLSSYFKNPDPTFAPGDSKNPSSTRWLQTNSTAQEFQAINPTAARLYYGPDAIDMSNTYTRLVNNGQTMQAAYDTALSEFKNKTNHVYDAGSYKLSDDNLDNALKANYSFLDNHNPWNENRELSGGMRDQLNKFIAPQLNAIMASNPSTDPSKASNSILDIGQRTGAINMFGNYVINRQPNQSKIEDFTTYKNLNSQIGSKDNINLKDSIEENLKDKLKTNGFEADQKYQVDSIQQVGNGQNSSYLMNVTLENKDKSIISRPFLIPMKKVGETFDEKRLSWKEKVNKANTFKDAIDANGIRTINN